MDPDYLRVLVGLLLAGLLYAFYHVAKFSTTRRTLPLPPGPKGAWFTPGPK